MPQVKCCVCGKMLNYTKEQAVRSKKAKRRYSHYSCEPDGELVPLPQKQEKPKTDEDKIFEYLIQIFGKDKVNYAMVKKQLATYRKEYNYTDSGILKCLHYWYDVKKNDPAKANGSIGIVPFIWADSYTYYFELWEAKQKNADKDVSAYIPKEEVVVIPNPERPLRKKRKLFSFLDKED